uniref:Uncharacterized protein n=1 Tax=Arundo donax TaxID=35708 RepID=A0A0A9HMG7_ARUDO
MAFSNTMLSFRIEFVHRKGKDYIFGLILSHLHLVPCMFENSLITW